MKKGSIGVTLIELMAVLVVSAIILGIGVPAMFELVRENRLTAVANTLNSDLRAARAEALKHRQRVTMCASADQTTCGAADWSTGWIVFLDENDNAQRDPGETVLRVQHAFASSVTIQGNGPVADYVSYLPTGLPRQVSGALQMGSISICEVPSARRIVMNAMGRSRIEKAIC